MTMSLDWHKMKTACPKEPKLCLDKLSDEHLRKNYDEFKGETNFYICHRLTKWKPNLMA